MRVSAYDRLAGVCAILAGLVGFLYAVSFVVISRSSPALGGLLSALCLLLVGLLGSVALVGLYNHLREIEPGFALWSGLAGLAGAFGTAVHGGYDLANAINPPASPNLDLPSAVDPRGLLSFGLTALALLVASGLMARSRGRWPSGLAYLGFALAALLLIIYLGRLTVLDPTNPVILVPVLLAGFLANPAWYVWLGVSLWRGQAVRAPSRLRLDQAA